MREGYGILIYEGFNNITTNKNIKFYLLYNNKDGSWYEGEWKKDY